MSDDSPRTHETSPATDTLLTPGEVAHMFRVNPKTVTRWAAAGHLGSIRTPGGHRRFRAAEVQRLLENLSIDASRPPDPGCGR